MPTLEQSPSPVVLQTSLPGLPVRRGKVRDVYDLGQQLLLVSTDRLSAFDWVLPTGIPDKGRVLTQVSAFWFQHLGGANHFITIDINKMPLPGGIDRQSLEGRTTLCRKTQVVPIECVVRGYLSGSGWAEYRKSGTVCGIKLPAGLQESSKLPEPIFTPATKAETGHDENITFEQMVDAVGRELSEELRRRSIDLFEVLTPDSSRFWPADQYAPGRGQPSFDKQFVRDWLTESGWDKNSQPPALPDDVVENTRAKYVESYEQLTGKSFG